jgi:hypothetical protein
MCAYPLGMSRSSLEDVLHRVYGFFDRLQITIDVQKIELLIKSLSLMVVTRLFTGFLIFI